MPEDGRLLVVDDDPEICKALGRLLSKEGFTVQTADSAEAALSLLRAAPFDVVLTDLVMGRTGGLELLRASRELADRPEFIVITGHGSVESAVAAVREGAYDYIEKPPLRGPVLQAVRQALERHRLLDENRRLKEALSGARPRQLLGGSPAMRRVLRLVEQVAPSSATVLVLGESGVGKELVAEAIHALSHRASGPLVKIDCAAIPDTLLESELFGHERGAFTGALSRKPGRFELADGGTVFLDEIATMSLPLQAKLLRVLQSGDFRRVGGTEVLHVDVRLIAATNENPEERVARGLFREDLYYRLNVIQVEVPPLRERREDIPLLAEHFLRTYAARNDKPLAGFSREALDVLTAYDWPGNVRELENAVESAVVMASGEWVGPRALPARVGGAAAGRTSVSVPVGTSLEEARRMLIEATLERTGGDKRAAARLLGISVRTIYRKLTNDE